MSVSTLVSSFLHVKSQEHKEASLLLFLSFFSSPHDHDPKPLIPDLARSRHAWTLLDAVIGPDAGMSREAGLGPGTRRGCRAFSRHFCAVGPRLCKARMAQAADGDAGRGVFGSGCFFFLHP